MATDYQKEVQKLYVAYFSRPADVAGQNYWMNVLQTNPNGYQEISASFASSKEYHDMYANMDNRSVVNAVYEHLFGRAAEATGLDYWTNLLNQKAITIDNVVTKIAAGAQGTDSVAYDGKVAVATAFTNHLDTTAEQQEYASAAALKIASDYVASVKDLQTAAAAIDPGHIDATIATFPQATGFAAVVASQPHVDATVIHG